MAHVSKSSSDKLAQRFARIRPADGELLFLAVYCNTCRRFEAANTLDDLLPKVIGWFIDDTVGGVDFCPGCRVDDGWAGSFPKPR